MYVLWTENGTELPVEEKFKRRVYAEFLDCWAIIHAQSGRSDHPMRVNYHAFRWTAYSLNALSVQALAFRIELGSDIE